jgi:hypothetical protein
MDEPHRADSHETLRHRKDSHGFLEVKDVSLCRRQPFNFLSVAKRAPSFVYIHAVYHSHHVSTALSRRRQLGLAANRAQRIAESKDESRWLQAAAELEGFSVHVVSEVLTTR